LTRQRADDDGQRRASLEHLRRLARDASLKLVAEEKGV
jgi:hypothetical protein